MIEFFILVMIVVAIVMAITSDRRPKRNNDIFGTITTCEGKRPAPRTRKLNDE